MVQFGSVVLEFHLRKREAVENLRCSFNAIILQE